jgi:hypothetical protein
MRVTSHTTEFSDHMLMRMIAEVSTSKELLVFRRSPRLQCPSSLINAPIPTAKYICLVQCMAFALRGCYSWIYKDIQQHEHQRTPIADFMVTSVETAITHRCGFHSFTGQ